MNHTAKPGRLPSRECHQCHKWGTRMLRSALHFERYKCEDCVNRDLRYAAPPIGPARSPGIERRGFAFVG
jgi:hypothetical protein